MSVANCVTYGGDYPEEHAFCNNVTVLMTKGPTIEYAAASVLIDLYIVFICGGTNYFFLSS